MAIAFVQQATGTAAGSTTATATLGSNPTSNNMLVACIASSAGDVSGVSGGGVTTWTKLKGPGNISSAWVNIYYGVVDTTPATGVTATATSGNIAINVSEWSGIKTSGAADASSDQDQGPGTTPTTGPITASAGPCLYVAAGTHGQTLSAGPTDGFTALTVANASGRRVQGVYRIDSGTPASATPSYTIGASASWDLIVGALQGTADATVVDPFGMSGFFGV